MANPAIELRNITKVFGSIVANKDVNLTVYKGEILSLLGENGSGKTTLMNMIAGIYYPDSGEILVLPERIMLSGFNISLFPHSSEEVRHRNYMHARFDSGENVLGTAAYTGDAYDPDHPGELFEPNRKGTAAVYSSPYGESAWRAGKGKAAVGLNGQMWILSQYRNEEGQSYACIRYDVSERTQRIGYALCRDLGRYGHCPGYLCQ